MVNIYKLKLTNLQQEILRLLFIKAGTSLNQRGIARMLEVSQPAVMKAIPQLEKEQFIKVEQDKESKRWSIELNRDNRRALQLKRADNLKQVYESGLADFLENEFAGAAIILFGSYARGEDTDISDMDIAIIGRKERHIDKPLSVFDKMLERTIHLSFYDSFEKIHKNLKDNVCNGIVLAGSVEL
ncbi:MAG TPA: MarR family transcriptional regulator [Nanoarchaeota archaeon]|nr:MarR family transcriptional regulator [Nanoarchaeota archaeon]